MVIPISDRNNAHPVQPVPNDLVMALIPVGTTFDHGPQLLDAVGRDSAVPQRIITHTHLSHRQKRLDEPSRNPHVGHWCSHGKRIKPGTVFYLDGHACAKMLSYPPTEPVCIEAYGLMLATRQFVGIKGLLSEPKDLPDTFGSLGFIVIPVAGVAAMVAQPVQRLVCRGEPVIMLVERTDEGLDVFVIADKGIALHVFV